MTLSRSSGWERLRGDVAGRGWGAGASAPGRGRPPSPHSHRHLVGSAETLGKDASGSRGHGGDHPAAARGCGARVHRSPPLRASEASDCVSCPPSPQPHGAPRAFLGSSRAGSPVLTCARTSPSRSPVLPQWSCDRRAGPCGGGRGRGQGGAGAERRPGGRSGVRGRGGQGPAPLAGSSLSPFPPPFLYRRLNPEDEGAGLARPRPTPQAPSTRTYLGKWGKRPLPASPFHSYQPLDLSLLVSSTVTPRLNGGDEGEGRAPSQVGPVPQLSVEWRPVTTCNAGGQVSRQADPWATRASKVMRSHLLSSPSADLPWPRPGTFSPFTEQGSPPPHCIWVSLGQNSGQALPGKKRSRKGDKDAELGCRDSNAPESVVSAAAGGLLLAPTPTPQAPGRLQGSQREAYHGFHWATPPGGSESSGRHC